MKNRSILITGAFLLVATGNYFRISTGSGTRTVEFLSIFAIGMLSGVLLTQLIKAGRDKKIT